MTLSKINEFIKKCNVEKEWKSFTPYKVIRFCLSDLTAENISGKDRFSANTKYGVYRLSVAGEVIYVGRGTDSPIGKRQISHLTSFRNTHNKHEQTGKKLREYMRINNINELIVQIEYIDMSHMKDSIEWFEKKCIRHYNPVLNTLFKK